MVFFYFFYKAGPFPLKHNQQFNTLDPLVLVDSLTAIMGHEEKELCKAANFAMILIIKTATDIMGTKEVFIIMNDKFKKLLNLFLLINTFREHAD